MWEFAVASAGAREPLASLKMSSSTALSSQGKGEDPGPSQLIFQVTQGKPPLSFQLILPVVSQRLKSTSKFFSMRY